MKNYQNNEKYFLMCERNLIYFSLMAVAGFWGAYTYLLRGNIFCNAQTGNVILMGMAFGSGKWRTGLYYFIPISAYILGSFISELAPNPMKRCFYIRWDTILVLIEMAFVFALGFIPESAPVQISQVMINFIASMQYNTFRQAEGEPMATTFATNHIRQIGVGLAKEIQHRNTSNTIYRVKLIKHFKMLVFFVIGTIVGTVCCNYLNGKAIWVTLIPLGIIFGILLYADLVKEKNLVQEKPAGH